MEQYCPFGNGWCMEDKCVLWNDEEMVCSIVDIGESLRLILQLLRENDVDA